MERAYWVCKMNSSTNEKPKTERKKKQKQHKNKYVEQERTG